MGADLRSPEALTRDAAMKRFRAGRVVLEQTSWDNARRSWNPDRRWRKAVSRELGIRTGRQWKRLRRAHRRAMQAHGEVARD